MEPGATVGRVAPIPHQNHRPGRLGYDGFFRSK